ncbi:nucleotide-binding protein [Longimicrobium sp.]|jgi:predicted nucleotide-binding protein|uniref:nucleotide-binding protein n=1 Tax=Longimicrobium sp. TaxID=2029185 RepID=UPI002ED78EF9
MGENLNYSGSIEDLRQAIAGSGTPVVIEEKANLVIFRTETGASCNWTISTGRLVVQGKEGPKQRLEEVIRKFVNRRAKRALRPTEAQIQPTKRKPKGKKIFVVHGHDKHSLDQLVLVLRELELEPVVLARESGGGLTIIEALEANIRRGSAGADFGIVLLTPDDVGHARTAGGTGTRKRARQNVILELGMLIGALGRSKIAILLTGDLELPSDIHGVLYAPFQSHVRETVPQLGKRLREAGFEITADAVLRASHS